MSLLFEEKFVRQKFPLTKFSTKKKVIQFYQNSVKKKKNRNKQCHRINFIDRHKFWLKQVFQTLWIDRVGFEPTTSRLLYI